MFRLENDGTQNEIVLDFMKCLKKVMFWGTALAVAYPICLVLNRLELWRDFVSVSILSILLIIPIAIVLTRWKVVLTENSIVVRSPLGHVKKIFWLNLKRARQDLDGNLWWLMDETEQIIQIPQDRYDRVTESQINQILEEKLDQLGIHYDWRSD